ncbi:MAG: heme ABC transporter permease [Caulobacterales bacterium]|jgi:heme exporter protein C
MISRFANPARFMQFSAWLTPALAVAACALFGIGLPWALIMSPQDYQMGETVRIMYVHVPAAWWALGLYAAMGVASFVSLVWRHALADVAARAMAPVGAVMAAVCLITGSIWGHPTWGTWWEWDARLTSMLVLFLTYLGYLALWASIDDEVRAGKLAAVLCLVGLINLPIVRFSVDWWYTLHQPASVLRMGGSAIDPTMLNPLLVMAAAFAAAAGALSLLGMRTHIHRRQAEAAEQRIARTS